MRKKHTALIIMIAPALLYLFVFFYIPMCGQIISFKDYVMTDGIFGSRWVGFENFARIFGDEDFFGVVLNTMKISVLKLFFGFFAPIVLALLLNEIRLSGLKRSIQTLTYLPHFFSWVILGGIFKMLLSNSGPVNDAIVSCGFQPVKFLTTSSLFISTLVWTEVWKGAGYGAIIYLAAISGISPQLYEAAMVDGASRWKQTLHITLPSLLPSITILAVLSVGNILTVGFDQIYCLMNDMVWESANVIDIFVFHKMRDLDLGLSTAAGMFRSVIGLSLVVSVNAIAKKMSGGEHGVW